MRALVLIASIAFATSGQAEGQRGQAHGLDSASQGSVAVQIAEGSREFEHRMDAIVAQQRVRIAPPAGAALLGGLGLYCMLGRRPKTAAAISRPASTPADLPAGAAVALA